ncbi:MAG TPA: acylphosphatase [Desulfomonilaceae bacterium]|nr:acylphosphatase [Desulfomonilaceae bacterium]
MTTIRRRVLVSGLVQGVNFRANTRAAARHAGVYGWVRNLPDGRVEAVFEGEPEKVNHMVAWCRKGPSFSRVSHVDVRDEEPTGEFKSFDISFGGGSWWS